MNCKEIIPFLVWLIIKLDKKSWTVLKSEIDKEFYRENQKDVISAGKQEDISKKINKHL